jgi:hypothetical protein
MQLPRGLGSSIGMIAVMCTSQKNMAPESLPRPNPIGVGYIRPPPFKFHIVTAVAAVKLPDIAPRQRVSAMTPITRADEGLCALTEAAVHCSDIGVVIRLPVCARKLEGSY